MLTIVGSLLFTVAQSRKPAALNWGWLVRNTGPRASGIGTGVNETLPLLFFPSGIGTGVKEFAVPSE